MVYQGRGGNPLPHIPKHRGQHPRHQAGGRPGKGGEQGARWKHKPQVKFHFHPQNVVFTIGKSDFQVIFYFRYQRANKYWSINIDLLKLFLIEQEY